MADEPVIKKRRIRKTETVRERAEKEQQRSTTPRRRSRIRKAAGAPFRQARSIGGISYEYKMPDNRIGRIMGKRVRFMPKYFRESWQELRKVDWPDRKQTARLTVAVIVFATVFGLFIVAIDFGLDKAFRKLFL